MVVFAGLGRVQAGKHLRLDLLEARQGSDRRSQVVGQFLFERDRVADLRRLQFLDARDDETDFARIELFACDRLRREHAQAVGAIDGVTGHQTDALVALERAVDHAHQHHHPDVVVEPRVDDHGAQRRVDLAARRRHASDDGLENVVDALAGLGAARNRIGRIDTDDIFDLLLGTLGVGLRKIHLVEHRNHMHAEFERGVAVGHRLGLDALARVDHQQSAFAGGQRAAHFVRKVDMARRVDQVELVVLPIAGLVNQRSRLRLDRDAAFTLDVHRVEHLRLHLAIAEAATTLDESVGQGRLAVVDVGNDREISDVIHACCKLLQWRLTALFTGAAMSAWVSIASRGNGPAVRAEAKKKARRNK